MWVEGNHDPDLPDGIPGTPCFEIVLDNMVFRHEVETVKLVLRLLAIIIPKSAQPLLAAVIQANALLTTKMYL